MPCGFYHTWKVSSCNAEEDDLVAEQRVCRNEEEATSTERNLSKAQRKKVGTVLFWGL